MGENQNQKMKGTCNTGPTFCVEQTGEGLSPFSLRTCSVSQLGNSSVLGSLGSHKSFSDTMIHISTFHGYPYISLC